MSEVFEYFGLAADADERAVKRAYAQRLKHTRPDDDPHAFRALYEAYQRALAACRSSRSPLRTASHNGESAPRPPLILEDTADAGAKARPDMTASPIDAAALTEEILDRALHVPALQLKLWLSQQTGLWSLSTKPQVGQRLWELLSTHLPDMPADSFDVLAAFFEWNTLQGRLNPLQVHALRDRLSLRQALADKDMAPLVWDVRKRVSPELAAEDIASILRELAQPFSWWRTLNRAIKPGATAHIHGLLRYLEGRFGGPLPAELINPGQAAFWRAAGDESRPGRPRQVLNALRCGSLSGVVTALIFLGRIGSSSTTWYQDIGLGIGAGAVLTLIWLSAPSVWKLLRAQLYSELAPTTRPWLRLFAIPLAAAGCLALSAVPFPVAGRMAHWMLIGLSVLAFLRLLRRLPPALAAMDEYPKSLFKVGMVLMIMVAIGSAAIHGNAWITVLVLWLLDVACNWHSIAYWRARAT